MYDNVDDDDDDDNDNVGDDGVEDDDVADHDVEDNDVEGLSMMRCWRWWCGGWWCWKGGRSWCWGGGPIPGPWTTLCASLHSRNARQHVIRATLYRNLQEKCRAPEWAQNADTHFVWACAVETHVKISQEALYTEIYRKNAGAHPHQAPAFTPTVRTPQCGHTVWGIYFRELRI